MPVILVSHRAAVVFHSDPYMAVPSRTRSKWYCWPSKNPSDELAICAMMSCKALAHVENHTLAADLSRVQHSYLGG